MKRFVKQFLVLTFLISFACFGILLGLKWNFQEVLSRGPGILLFTLGCLGPTIAAILVYALHPAELGGTKGLWSQVTAGTNPKSWLLVPFFLLLHYGLAILLNVAGAFGSPLLLLQYIPIMLVLFGAQEIGWRLILLPALNETRGFWKSTVSVGLFLSIWFLPLLVIPGFFVRADFFLQFAGYMVGLNLLQTTIRRQGGSILACAVFTGLFFALSAVVSLVQSNLLLAATAVDVVIAVLYNSRLVKDNLPKA